jgi:hypothetical protein
MNCFLIVRRTYQAAFEVSIGRAHDDYQAEERAKVTIQVLSTFALFFSESMAYKMFV